VPPLLRRIFLDRWPLLGSGVADPESATEGWAERDRDALPTHHPDGNGSITMSSGLPKPVGTCRPRRGSRRDDMPVQPSHRRNPHALTPVGESGPNGRPTTLANFGCTLPARTRYDGFWNAFVKLDSDVLHPRNISNRGVRFVP
jgi:hypothetical protein